MSFETDQTYEDMIWKRGTHEYLSQMKKRSKWSKEHVRNLKEGELVWLVDDCETLCVDAWTNYRDLPGNDGVVRSARVRMAYGELNRPVVKVSK